MNDFERAIQELKTGNFSEGIVILQDMLKKDPDNVDILYNLGMAYSEMGIYKESIEVLEKCITIEPENANSYAALGFSYYKKDLYDDALSTLIKAVKISPNNIYALKNLGAVYGKIGEPVNAIPHLEKANDLSPNNPEILIGLAQAYEQGNSLDKASKAYKNILQLKTTNLIEQMAEEGLTRIAIANLKSKGYRVDIVMYCFAALQLFAKMPNEKIKEIAFEIAILGTSGIDINNPQSKYTLNSLNGNFSGLQLVSYMFVGFKQLDDKIPPAADFEEEYQAALELFRSKQNE